MQREERRLEVVVSHGRCCPQGRIKVALTICSENDREGVEWGAKVSPWTGVEVDGSVRFGQAGLRTQFPLGNKGPRDLVSDPRFLESAVLRIQVYVSGLVGGAAPEFLRGVIDPLDQATRSLLAEERLPLANTLCGRVGFAADRALGGWIQLGMDAPGLWMQVYVLPDHASSVPHLEAQLRGVSMNPEEGGKPAQTAQAAPPPLRPAPPLASAAGPWGQGEQRRAPAAAAPTVRPPENLLDLDFGGPDPAAGSGSIDLLSGGPADALVEGPGLVDISLDDDASPIGAEAGSAVAGAFSFMDGSAAPATGPSAFNFVNVGAPSGSGMNSDGSSLSAFGFAGTGQSHAPVPPDAFGAVQQSPAGSSVPSGPVAALPDLKALYATAGPPVVPTVVVGQNDARFTALKPGWSNFDPSRDVKQLPKQAPLFQDLEKDIMNNLKI